MVRTIAVVLVVLCGAFACASTGGPRPEAPPAVTAAAGPVAALAGSGGPQAGAAEPTGPAEEYRGEQDYRIGPRDTLRIDVFNQPDLGGRYTVETDGTLAFPLIGRVAVAGYTVRTFEQALADRLSAGYFRDPRVTVAVDAYNSQRVFIVGEVRQPGAYPLAGEMRVLELLALAGSVTSAASREAVVVRAEAGSDGPTLPRDRVDAETLRVDLGALETGDLAQNVALRHGDTVFVPEADVVYVFGEVRNAGRYPIRKDTIVLHALSLAGGSTEFAALNRVRIVRVVNGRQVEIDARLDDPVQPDDIIRVPERFF